MSTMLQFLAVLIAGFYLFIYSFFFQIFLLGHILCLFFILLTECLYFLLIFFLFMCVCVLCFSTLFLFLFSQCRENLLYCFLFLLVESYGVLLEALFASIWYFFERINWNVICLSIVKLLHDPFIKSFVLLNPIL